MKQVSFRVEETELQILDSIAISESKDRTSLLRELVQEKIAQYNW